MRDRSLPLALLAALVVLPGCPHDPVPPTPPPALPPPVATPAPAPTPAPTPAPAAATEVPDVAGTGGTSVRYGSVMRELAARFETAGRAALVGRWEYAAYQLEEIDEGFSQDLPHAVPPPGRDRMVLRGLIESFRSTQLDGMVMALRAHDLARFRTAFAATSRACNACHQAMQSPFIEVPDQLGVPVPRMDPATPDVAGRDR